jgi:hypothetical protein
MLLDYFNGVSISRVLSTNNDHLMLDDSECGERGMNVTEEVVYVCDLGGSE